MESIQAKKGSGHLITPVFDRPSFNSDLIIPLENSDTGRKTFLNIREEKVSFLNLSCVLCYGGDYRIVYKCT